MRLKSYTHGIVFGQGKPKRNFQIFAKKCTLAKYQSSDQRSLDNAKFDDNDGYALWVEEDYCSPPLAMERESVLDRYFNDITVQLVESEQEGWSRINDKPWIWRRE
jgi:hypothetical protein